MLFLCIKVSKTSVYLTLLRYYLLLDKPSWKFIKQSITTKSNSKSQKYSALDLTVAQKPEVIAAYKSISEKFASSVLENNIGLLHSLKLSKRVSIKGKSIFEEPGFLWLYVMVNLIQLIYYQAGDNLEERNIDPEKIDKELVTLLEDMIKYVVSFSLEKSMDKILEALTEKCEKHYKNYLPTNSELLVRCYNFISQINEEKGNFIYNSKNEKNPLNIAIHELGFKNFKSSLKNWLTDLFLAIKLDPSKLWKSVIDNNYTKNLQPYLILITENNLRIVDTLIRNKMYTDSVDFMGNLYNYKEELQKFSNELQEAIYEKFGHISIPKKKMGNFSY